MAQDDRDILDILKFELSFLEDGGYGRSPHAPWRAPAVFEDSPICPNFCDPRGRIPVKAACWNSSSRTLKRKKGSRAGLSN